MPSGVQSAAIYLVPLAIGVVAWLVTHLVGKPFLAYRELRAEIVRCLILYANVPTLPAAVLSVLPLPDRAVEARTKYRDLASQLMAWGNTIAVYRLWALLAIIPTREELEEAKRNLIGLSNTIGDFDQGLETSRRVDNIRRALRIKIGS